MESTPDAKAKTIQGKSKDTQETERIPINIALKAKYAAYTTLIFFLIANPETYKLLQKFIGTWISVASEGGCPTPVGFFLHTGLFFVFLWSFMLFPRDY